MIQENKQEAFDAFMKKNPGLEEYERELKLYLGLEQEIAAISPVFNIGSLSLQTQPMKDSLRAEAAAWKQQYARSLHSKAKERLDAIMEYIVSMTKNIQREVKDLEDLRYGE